MESRAGVYANVLHLNLNVQPQTDMEKQKLGIFMENITLIESKIRDFNDSEKQT